MWVQNHTSIYILICSNLFKANEICFISIGLKKYKWGLFWTMNKSRFKIVYCLNK